jgi:hypothetical protein
MKLADLKDIDRDDILGALGLQSKPSAASWIMGTLGVFGLGLLCGAGMALLMAPKPGRELRRELGTRLRSALPDMPGNGRTREAEDEDLR